MRYKRSLLSGWGNYPIIETHLYRPEKIRDLYPFPDEPSILGRGLGRSYGDAALNDQGGMFLFTRLSRFLAFDETNGVLHAEAGVSFDEILKIFVPRGWFLPVTPGTKFVTLGGAIASDVHGKNHHVDGAISNYIVEIEVLLANGEKIICSRNQNKEVFEATIGGNGLTGLIISAKLRLQSIETSFIKQFTIKAKNFEEAIELFDTYDRQYRYSVAWVDSLAKGRSLGRSVVMFGNHAKIEDLHGSLAKDSLVVHSNPKLNIPFYFPSSVLNGFSLKGFNLFYYWKQIPKEKSVITHYNPFFYPLDGVNHWNRIYGKAGLLQWQCVIPLDDGKEGLQKILNEIQSSRHGAFLAVLKKMGPQGGLLNFPMEGYTLALDFANRKGILELFKRLNKIVLGYGGRIYLTKDAHLERRDFEQMYPRIEEWKKIKKEIDAQNKFISCQSKRLGLLN